MAYNSDEDFLKIPLGKMNGKDTSRSKVAEKVVAKLGSPSLKSLYQ